MANREYNTANSFETTLSASLGAGDTTINVQTTDGTPGVPFYIVIDPNDDTKREVVGVDSGKTGTTFTLSSASQRGLDGTSDVAHDSGAVVGIYPIAAYWVDIHDRVDLHEHSGGGDSAQIDHGDLSGLGNDDHTQYHNDSRHDAHDHSTAAASIASGDLADHDKATHDALNIDADTVDGIDGATTIQDGLDDINAVVSASAELVNSAESTSSTSFTDLSTAGPSVTITTGTVAWVNVVVEMENDTAGELSIASVEVSGASTDAADINRSLLFESGNAGDRSRASVLTMFTGLTAGSNTFTIKYRVSGGTGTFRRRRIEVLPIGA